ncbi:MAG: 4-hydroxy-tetrahydrodipicolinate reductase [Spirochaetia bacterium]|jgi:4-hydroxy-tetrahydrodipicolinate reductase|nr:4-hydroxy-tetrahydrodipicolinate reductase [Spirochaetia bacterium]
MKVLLIGYGSMGKEIEKALISRGHSLSGFVDPIAPGGHKEVTANLLEKADVVIDFSSPAAVESNCDIYVQGKTPVVMGTTGWEQIREKIEKKVNKAGIGFIWGSNYSIGAHLFFILAEKAASLINSLPEYDILLHEYHHRRKKDSPSGTALTAASKILEQLDRKETITTQTLDRQIKENELHVTSTRCGEIHGTHTLMLDSAADTIEITHRARNRSGFALGAVMAAEWVKDKKGFITVERFIKELLG